MPKDVFGRQTNVKKAEKAAYKMDAKRTSSPRGYKKFAKSSARDMGFSKGLDKAKEKMESKSGKSNPFEPPSLDYKPEPEKTPRQVAAGRTAKKVDRDSSYKLERFAGIKSRATLNRDADEKANVTSRAIASKLSGRAVSKAINKGEKKASKVTKKVYKSELKKANTEAAVKKAMR